MQDVFDGKADRAVHLMGDRRALLCCLGVSSQPGAACTVSSPRALPFWLVEGSSWGAGSRWQPMKATSDAAAITAPALFFMTHLG